MNRKYVCYCGLYCGNCAVKAKIEPAAKVLLNEMKAAGFEEIISFIPGGTPFWSFLVNMPEGGICISCKDGSGNPACKVRLCAKQKDVETCAFCEDYPCEHMNEFNETYPSLKQDNALLSEKGWDTWGEMQDERQARGYTYSDEIQEKNRNVEELLTK